MLAPAKSWLTSELSGVTKDGSPQIQMHLPQLPAEHQGGAQHYFLEAFSHSTGMLMIWDWR